MADFIEEAIKSAEITLEITPIENNSYKCSFKSKHHAMMRNITMAEGYDAPKLGNLIYYYATEIQHYEDCDDILEWADDNGINPGDERTIKRYNQLSEDHKDLRLLLGEDNYQGMMSALAISQAISNAIPR